MRERASERARRGQLRTNLVALAGVATAGYALALAYGDDRLAVACAIGALAAGVLLTMSRGLAFGTFSDIISVGVAAVAAFAQFGTPDPLVGLMIYIPIGIAAGSMVERSRFACTVSLVSLVLPMAVMALTGWWPPASPTPGWVVWTAAMTGSGAAIYFQLITARRASARALRQISTARARLVVEREALSARRTYLLDATAEYREEIARLTRQMMLENALAVDLERKREEREQLVHAIHQDLREPLRGIVSFTQLIRRRLRRDAALADVGEYLAFAEDGGLRMASMLEDLVAYTSEPEGERLSRVDLVDLLGDIEGNLADLIARTGATVRIDPLPVVWGQRTPLVQLFQNLIANALKFSRPGVPPRIELRASDRPDGGVEIAVVDNGVGIPANQLARVFGLFNRAHEGSGYEGSGVGLALCRKIAIAHGGEIRVASVPAEGSVFTVALPAEVVVVGASRSAQPAAGSTPAKASGPERGSSHLQVAGPGVPRLSPQSH